MQRRMEAEKNNVSRAGAVLGAVLLSDGARPRTARRLPGRPVLKPVLPVPETLARSTPFRNKQPQLDLTSTRPPFGHRQATRLPAPDCASLALPCPALPHSNPRHFTSTHVRPPPVLCCPVFEEQCALPPRPPPAINALPTHPYLVATVRYARPRLKHHPQSQERHVCSCLCPCGWWVCECVRLGVVRLTFPGTIAWHRMASHRSAAASHPIAASAPASASIRAV